MTLHYIKIAFRNMWKYKSQTLISIIGLAVGFTCFALATLWIRYEMTFDNFHKNAKQMYAVYAPNVMNPSGYSRFGDYLTPSYLKETFPEVSNAISFKQFPYSNTIKIESIEFPASTFQVDSSFLRMFDVKILEGSHDFLIPGSNKLAITQKKSRQLFGDENPIGKTINDGVNEICAIVSDLPGHSNYAFDFLGSNKFRALQTIIELFPETDIKAFEKKLYEHKKEKSNIISKLIIRPITKMRYTDPDMEKEVKFQYILIFSISGILVILCSLFNYFTLFVSRFRIRQKELALRVVCGASGVSLLKMLSVEFILTLLFAIGLGFMLTQLVYKPFLTLSEIQMDLSQIYRESLIYISGIILLSLLAFWLILYIFRKRSLNLSIRQNNKSFSRKISIVVQLVISIVFALCTIVILKQMYFLHHTDELGFSFQNVGSVAINENITMETNMENNSILVNQLKQIPEITEILDAGNTIDLLKPSVVTSIYIGAWEGKSADTESIAMERMSVSPDYFSFYKLQLVAGEMLTEIDPYSLVMLNESAIKALGWSDPVGKKIEQYTVKGVIKNVYNSAPTTEARPILYLKGRNEPVNLRPIIGIDVLCRVALFKYMEGTWKSCKDKIENLVKTEYINNSSISLSSGGITITNNEEEYNKHLKSENNLVKLLSFVSAICIFICVFGFVSLVSLTCEERRKEIAIRKINGATVDDIISIFAKEYFLLLMIGAVIAFSAGYYIMQRWLENYVKQTSIPVWIYLAIILVLALIIILCVGWQVYRASVENPAEVVKGS